jgi:hypothetical protein
MTKQMLKNTDSKLFSLKKGIISAVCVIVIIICFWAASFYLFINSDDWLELKTLIIKRDDIDNFHGIIKSIEPGIFWFSLDSSNYGVGKVSMPVVIHSEHGDTQYNLFAEQVDWHWKINALKRVN